MHRWKVLVSAPYFQPVLEQYRALFESHGIELVVPHVRERLSETELLQYITDIDGVIAGDDRFTARVFAHAPKLKVVAKWGTGIDSIDREAAARHGVAVQNTPNAFTEPVADTTFGFLLSFARRIPWIDHAMKRGGWDKRPGVALNESTLGVIGIGNIGSAVVRRAAAFGMRVLGNDIRAIPAVFVQETGLEVTDLASLLRQSDFVSIHCDLNPTSERLLSDQEFALMKPTTVIINTARGPIVDEPALIRALQGGVIAGAGLDVFHDEPLPFESPLRSMENVLLSPHNANASPAAWQRVHDRTVRELIAALQHCGARAAQ